MTQTPTPGPWTFDGQEIWAPGDKAVNIAKMIGKQSLHAANAAFIIRACNNFEAMLGLLKHLIHEADHPDNQTDKELVEQIDWEGIRTAIAKAEGKES